MIFTGDLRSPAKILAWLSNRKDPSGVNIQEVDGEELKSLFVGDDSVVVYFYNKTRCTCEVEKLSRREKKKLESEVENLAELEQGEENSQRSFLMFVIVVTIPMTSVIYVRNFMGDVIRTCVRILSFSHREASSMYQMQRNY